MRNVVKKIKEIIKKIDKKSLIIFLIPFISFFVYLIVFYPGAFSFDTYTQFRQIKNFSFTSSHPFFHTYIELLFLIAFKTPAAIGLFQIICFSSLWTKICKYNRKKYDTKKVFIFQIIISILIGFNPLNGVMSIVLWKDVLFSYFILWLTFKLQQFIDKDFKVSVLDTLLTAFILMAAYNFRYNGLIVVIGISILLCIIFFIKDRKKYNYIWLIVFIVLFNFMFVGLNKIFNVNSKEDVSHTSERVLETEMLTMVGTIAREGYISQEDKDLINKFASYERLVKYAKYNCHDAISICHINFDYIMENREEFIGLVLRVIRNNKSEAFDYIAKENAFIWKIVRLDDSWGYIIKYDSHASNEAELYYKQVFEGTFIYKIFQDFLEFSMKNKFFQTIFYSGSLYLYIILICAFFTKKYGKNNLIILSPLILIYIGLILTMPVNDVRYYYMTFLIAYYYLVLAFCTKKEYKKVTHCFVIPAYKESKYLEELIKSLKNQTTKSEILITTSTYNEYIETIAKKYNIKVIKNKNKPNIGKDFDNALNAAKTDLVTIAHQDDIYDKDFAERVINAYNRSKNPLIIFTNYYELRGKKKIKYNEIMIVKRLLLGLGGIKGSIKTRLFKKKVICLGCSIMCPSVTYVKKRMPVKLYESDLKCNVDWRVYEMLSKEKGEFVSIHKKIMGHRIHEESETSNSIRLNVRKEEDLKMFEMFWPKRVAKILCKFYSRSENSNSK